MVWFSFEAVTRAFSPTCPQFLWIDARSRYSAERRSEQAVSPVSSTMSSAIRQHPKTSATVLEQRAGCSHVNTEARPAVRWGGRLTEKPRYPNLRGMATRSGHSLDRDVGASVSSRRTL